MYGLLLSPSGAPTPATSLHPGTSEPLQTLGFLSSFTPLATVPSMQQNSIMPAQRSSAETSELRAALLEIFPDSEQKLKIDQILVAHPYMKDLNALSALVLDWRLG